VGYVFSLADAERQEKWFGTPEGQGAITFEQELLRKVWAPISPQRVLEVGCGSGIFLEWFKSQGHMVAGVEPSSSSLELARRRLGSKVRLNQGFAENLPYEDNEFDTVAFITSLEFVDDPVMALKEAFRVARGSVLLGVLNKYSLGQLQYNIQRFWKKTVFSRARFFSVFQLSRISTGLLSGAVPIEWRTCFTLPLPLLRYIHLLERMPLFQRHPFGHFIAMRIDMRCRVRTLQTPVFNEIPAGAKVSIQSLGCWRSSGSNAVDTGWKPFHTKSRRREKGTRMQIAHPVK
jgi:SAM-dependent methyltransferase